MFFFHFRDFYLSISYLRTRRLKRFILLVLNEIKLFMSRFRGINRLSGRIFILLLLLLYIIGKERRKEGRKE